MHFETIPPYRHISSASLPTSSASALLEKYLTNSESHPHLHPDALITPTGVTFSSHGGPMGGVIMHNLRRVAAGLRGEYLEPEATPEPEEAEAATWKKGKKGGKKDDGEAWQSMSEFEREEGAMEVGEVGTRDNVVGEVEVVGEENGEVGLKRKTEDGLDKEARKKAKKERLKEEKRKKEQAKEGKSK